VNDCVGDIGVAVWIALGRAHQGGVTNLAGQWRDFGSPVPGSVADALDRLTSSGQLALAVEDPKSCGARRVTVTDAGRARYVTLCQVHHCPDSGRPPAETAPGARPDTTTPVNPASGTGGAGGGDLQCGSGVHRGMPRPADLPVIDSPEAAGRALGELFLTNADRGNDAANDDLVAEVVRRIRAQQGSRDGGRGQQPPSQPAATAQLPTPQFGNFPDSGRPPVEQPRTTFAPGGQPDPSPRAEGSSGRPLRWARCPHDGYRHLLWPAEVVGAPTTGHAHALCGHLLPAEGLNHSVGALCLTCLTATSPREEQLPPEAHSPATGKNVPTARRWIGHQPAPR
jgi:hypothetical protein